MTQTICLFLGRFQPFHNGHLIVLKGMVKLCHKIVIGIGSPDAPVSAENPFSVQERREMIQHSLQAIDLIPTYDISLIDMPDLPDDEVWARQCLKLAGGEITTVWTGNEWTKRCFEEIGIPVQTIKEVPGVSATEVRRRMLQNGAWEDLVPKDVVNFIETNDGIGRLRRAA